MKIKILLIQVMVLHIVFAYTQDQLPVNTGSDSLVSTNPCLDKNIVYVSGGIIPGTFIGGNYERIFWSDKMQSLHLLARIGIGKIHIKLSYPLFIPVLYYGAVTEVHNYRSYLVNLGILTGRKRSHFELAFGAMLLDGTKTIEHSSGKKTEERNQEFDPAVSLGYRYQNPEPGHHFIFRIGVGWPEMLNMSMGFCF